MNRSVLRAILHTLTTLFALICFTVPAQSSVIYVKWDSPSNGPGNDWDHAYHAVTAGVNASTRGGEVWVAKGTYVESVTLKLDVSLYGGFAGAELERDQRDHRANVTIIQGDGSRPVITAPQGVAGVVDGFTIRNGRDDEGAGVRCSFSSPRITNNTITANCAVSVGHGGGIYCHCSSPIIANNTITANYAASGGYGGGCGGGIYCDYSSPIIANNTITANDAGSGGYGGGIYCRHGEPVIRDNVIESNSATDGGGICVYLSENAWQIISSNVIAGNSANCGGGVYCDSSSPVIRDNLIADNRAVDTWGGGIYCQGSRPTITNNTITYNSSVSGGGGLHCTGFPLIANNIIAFNSSGIYFNDGQPLLLAHNNVYGNGGYNYSRVSPGLTDISRDPLFLAPWVREQHLRPDSPCIDAGDIAFVAADSTDLDGKPRILPVGGTVDIGCFEYDNTPYWVRSVCQARAVPEEFPVELRSKPVTAAFQGSFYIEDLNRTGGIRVLSGRPVSIGDSVTIAGRPAVGNGERVIQADSVSVAAGRPTGIPAPLFARNNWLGGGSFFWLENGEQCGQPGITGGCGLNNIGLLVMTSGRFTKTSDTTFTLDDGSGVVVKCIAPPEVTLESSWRYAAVTGISSCEKAGDELHRLLRVRMQSDILAY